MTAPSQPDWMYVGSSALAEWLLAQPRADEVQHALAGARPARQFQFGGVEGLDALGVCAMPADRAQSVRGGAGMRWPN